MISPRIYLYVFSARISLLVVSHDNFVFDNSSRVPRMQIGRRDGEYKKKRRDREKFGRNSNALWSTRVIRSHLNILPSLESKRGSLISPALSRMHAYTRSPRPILIFPFA